jgi:hypothetical protein
MMAVDADPDIRPPRPWGQRLRLRLPYWMRDLHLYVGLFLSPFLLLFAVSAIFYNHAWVPAAGAPAEPQTTTHSIQPPAEGDDLAVARQLLDQLGITGEIHYVRREPARRRLAMAVEHPGAKYEVRVDLRVESATVTRTDAGLAQRTLYLHRMPGPHNASVRGNWLPTRLWGYLADATVYLLLATTLTGIYLWLLIRAERKRGLLLLAAGAVSFILLVLGITL